MRGDVISSPAVIVIINNDDCAVDEGKSEGEQYEAWAVPSL